ncbi:mitochondrial large ribosomal subunit [Coemansia brasiliensis]|uniref:Large ribosomal subunit protein mL49 n=1 Tax=Coemansia brasiliensis TaxID=2650707 RepID=A0A9W8LXT6_9FUNG|nr:mitochondrial large ribosomal subunit [Coemansia brasiliensis]
MFKLLSERSFAHLRLLSRFTHNESTLAALKTAANSVPRTYPYFINRTRFQSLPVYVDVKNGKTRRLTIVRRIEGDINAFHRDITNALNLETLAIKNASSQLVFRGDCAQEIRKWLTEKGF